MRPVTSVLFSGVGGQGIILASKVLARCAFDCGYMVKESEMHGMAQRGGSVTGHVRFGKEVSSPLIPKGGADCLVAMEELEGLRNADYLKPKGRIIFNRRKVSPSFLKPGVDYPEDIKFRLDSLGFQVAEIDALKMAKRLSNFRVENLVLLGALSRYLSLSLSAWTDAVKESVPIKTVELNLAAFKMGRDFVTQ
ncbi:MAG: indolepyruvate oxidoreductase subunit beta [Candidatus Omnitrophota bacterium]